MKPRIEHNYLPHANGFSNKPNAVYNYKVVNHYHYCDHN